jgi:hypothetical protein
MLRGKCRRCGWGIPLWYFLYELVGTTVGVMFGVFLFHIIF